MKYTCSLLTALMFLAPLAPAADKAQKAPRIQADLKVLGDIVFKQVGEHCQGCAG